MEAILYNQQGKEAGRKELPEQIFGLNVDENLIKEVVVWQLANRRQATTHTKDRSAVRGGGRKPWRQKGTGRARHGSRRSPLWKGGGVTFGPIKEKIYQKKINRKIRRQAALMVLSAKARDSLLILIDKLEIKEAKTKKMTDLLKIIVSRSQSVGEKNKKRPLPACLIILPSMDKKLLLAVRNLPNAAIRQAKDLNALDLLCFKYVVMAEESIKTIKENFLPANGQKE